MNKRDVNNASLIDFVVISHTYLLQNFQLVHREMRQEKLISNQ